MSKKREREGETERAREREEREKREKRERAREMREGDVTSGLSLQCSGDARTYQPT